MEVIKPFLDSEEIKKATYIQKGWISFKLKILPSQNLAENYTSTHFWDLKVFIWFIKEETYLDFSENNQINIEDTETFHRIPRLAHHLEQVVHRPGIYHIDEIAKLQKDKGQFLRKVYQTEDLDLD